MAASQSLALAVTGPGDSPAPAESPTRRLDSFQFPSFQVRSLSLSSLARPAASHAGGPAVEEPGRPFKLRPRAGPLAVGAAAEPSARRTRSSGSSLSSLSRTQASVPSLRARLRLGCQPEPGPAARGASATGSLSDCSSWSCAACAAATPSDGTVLPQAGPAPPSAGAGAGGTVTGPQPEI